MKSAMEIALEKTKNIQPADDPLALTPDEKEAVRTLNKEYDAKIAEIETRFNSQLRSMRETHGEQEIAGHLEQFYIELKQQRDIINAERKAATEQLLRSFGK